MPFLLNRRYQNLRRYRQIGEILLRHGFGYLIQQADLIHILPPFRRIQSYKAQDSSLSLATRIRLVFEELGPTFIKFGQILSTRPDLIPPDIIKELEKLQSDVQPVEFLKIQKQIEGELKCSLDQVFDYFEPQPLAAASIGQVHRGRLRDGTEVVVKVQRPNVRQVITADLEILYSLARSVNERLAKNNIDVIGMVSEFSRVLQKELDYTKEARNIERFRYNFRNVENVKVPEVYWSFTTEKILTMEFLDGHKLSEIATLKQSKMDIAKIGNIAAHAFMKQVFEDGFFHADPHPGNLLVLKDGRLGIIDFGMMGRIDEKTMQTLARLLVAVVKKKSEDIIKILMELEAFIAKPSRELVLDLEEVMDYHYGKTLKELDFSQIIEDLLELVRKHPLRMPNEFLLLSKALITLEGTGSALVPDFNVVEVAEPYAKNWMKEYYSPTSVIERGIRSSTEWLETLSKLPSNLDSVLRTMDEGELRIRFQHEGLENFINRLDIISNRIAFGLITGALIVGSSLLFSIDSGPRFLQVPLIGLSGFFIAGIMGLWLLISILRSGRFLSV
ncbi:MAG: AarF/ABC1/UbiB kinase family protein [Firmicutes bacterium]|nr:AarF/ABC1/UbiB kinase family protein [Bacillota bacterium]